METGTGAGTGREKRGSWRGERAREPMNVIVEVGRKTQERGRHQRVTSNHRRKTRCPSETVASSCGGLELRDGRRETRSRRAEKGRKSTRNPIGVIDAILKTGETLAEGEKNLNKMSWFSRRRPRISRKQTGDREGSARQSRLR